jgi:hypothetical protein
MSERITREQFCEVYVPMALAGNTALEIANKLGVDKPTDAEKSQFVSQKAAMYRRALGADAEKLAAKEELDEKATAKLVKEAKEKFPKLQNRVVAGSFASYLDDLLAKCDAPPKEGETTEETETPE